MSDRTETVQTGSADETQAFGRAFAKRLGAGDCVALVGPLGAGKTVLVRGMAEGLGVEDTRLVCSPTYVIVHEYAGRCTLYHLDLYRIGSEDELADLGVEEMLSEGVVVVEWADRAADRLPARRWTITIEMTGLESRLLTATCPGQGCHRCAAPVPGPSR